jgi:hypothetical protein
MNTEFLICINGIPVTSSCLKIGFFHSIMFFDGNLLVVKAFLLENSVKNNSNLLMLSSSDYDY